MQVVTIVTGVSMVIAYGVLITIFVLKFNLPGADILDSCKVPCARRLKAAAVSLIGCCLQRPSSTTTHTSMLALLLLACAWLRCSSVAAFL